MFFNTEIKRGSASERKRALISEKADLNCIAAMCVYLDASICTFPLQERGSLLDCIVNPSNMFEMQISTVRLGERMCMYLLRSTGDAELMGNYTHF